MKRSPWKRKPGKPMKRSPMSRSSKPMNKIGKQGKENAKADRQSKKNLEKAGLDFCQLCGRNTWLSRSHSDKRRFSNDLVRVALLCTFPCHNFIEHKLDAETRRQVNEFIINTTLEGEAKFEAVLEMIPENRREEFIKVIFRQ